MPTSSSTANQTTASAPHSRNGAVIVGAGRHAAEVIDALQSNGLPIHGCIDRSVPVGTEIYPNVRVVATDGDLTAIINDGFESIYLGIGGLANQDARRNWFDKLLVNDVAPPPLVHASAHIAPTVRLGTGTTVLARATIGPLSTIGQGCIIAQNAVITHHCRLADHVVIAPNATLAAGVRIDESATIGMNVTVLHDLHIGRRAWLINGVDVFQNIPANAVVKHHGPPASIRPAQSD
jgi:sugar O-acyltransferase (sialic acid O-acetyltransferase NeuD family)